MRRILAVLAIAIGLSACGGDDDKPEADEPAADELVDCSSFAGADMTTKSFTACSVDDATADLLNVPAGQTFLPATANTLCEDGSVLIWNDLGWGYEGQAFTLHTDEANLVPPEAEREGCESGSL